MRLSKIETAAAITEAARPAMSRGAHRNTGGTKVSQSRLVNREEEKHMSRRTARIPALAMAITLYCVASGAHAVDQKSYPASMCQEMGSGESGDINRSPYRLARTANSTGYYGGKVLCPIVRDAFAPSSIISLNAPGPGLSVEVYVNDQHALAIECSLIFSRFNGSGLHYRNASSAARGSQVLKMSMGTRYGGGIYQLQCRLPQHNIPWGNYTRFFSYVVKE